MEKAPISREQSTESTPPEEQFDPTSPFEIKITDKLREHLEEIAEEAMRTAPSELKEEVAINAVAAELSELQQIMHLISI